MSKDNEKQTFEPLADSSPKSASTRRFILDSESGFVWDTNNEKWMTSAEEVFTALHPLLPNAPAAAATPNINTLNDIKNTADSDYLEATCSGDAPDFITELRELLNRRSMENGSDTPDFILAQYLTDCLRAWNCATKRREDWYGRTPQEVFPPNSNQ